MATLAQLESALAAADAAGNMDDASQLAAVIRREKKKQTDDPTKTAIDNIPGMDTPQVAGTVVQEPEPSLGDKIIGAGEAGLTALTGATTGTAGMIGGALKGVAEEVMSGEFGSNDAADRIEESAMEGQAALTYMPKTEQGQEYLQDLGEAAEFLIPLGPLAGEMAAVGSAGRAAGATARGAGKAVMDKAIKPSMDRLKQELPAFVSPKPQGGKSIGSAEVPKEQIRRSAASELPVPIDNLTKGQASRKFEDVQFERETAKSPQHGEALRKRFSEHNVKLQQNMDAMIDGTGAEMVNLRDVGGVVRSALEKRASKDKTKIRTLYKKAEKAGDMEEPVVVKDIAHYFHENASAESLAPIINVAKKEMVKLGGAKEVNGNLLVNADGMSIKDVEQVRKLINKSMGSDATNIKFGSEMKTILDAATDGKGGDAYKKARAARSKFGDDYERIGLIDNLLSSKRGSNDRKIALEDVLRKSVLEPSTDLDSIKELKRLLTSGKRQGKQAWSELQGGMLRHIRDESMKRTSPDADGMIVLSPAALGRIVEKLDKNGKLDFVLGDATADKVRLVNDVAKDLMTAPDGSVNTSNTASALIGLMDMTFSASSGVPAPMMTILNTFKNGIKDRKLKARVERALGDR